MKSLTVATLAGGRPGHLANLVRGLAQQERAPDELIVAVMQDQLYTLPDAPFPVRQIRIEGEGLPLAAARNCAATAAIGEALVFLDMDCVATPTLVADYARWLSVFDGLLMGEVRYLPDGAVDARFDWTRLEAIGVLHADRRGPPAYGIESCEDYRCFWSLNFAVRRQTFLDAGGFDERYVGYGGEDTDFGKAITLAGVPIAWMKGGRAYHQYHPHHMPPIHHLDSVVRNTELFADKWGYRTMGHWLHAFNLMGLIDDTPGRPIRILRRPEAADFALTGQQSHQPFASSAAVIRVLEARQADAAQDAA